MSVYGFNLLDLGAPCPKISIVLVCSKAVVRVTGFGFGGPINMVYRPGASLPGRKKHKVDIIAKV